MIPLTEIVLERSNVSSRIGTRGRKGVVVLNISQKCELRCIYCYANSNTQGKYLGKDNISKVVENISRIDPRLVIVSGGEPLAYPYIEDLLNELYSENVRIILSSNGLLINDKVVNMLKKYDIEYVGISLDIPATEDSKIRKGSDYYKILTNIRTILSKGIEVGIRTTLTKANIYTIEEMLKLCKKNNIRRYCIYHLAPSGKAIDVVYRRLKPDKRIEARLVGYLVKICREYSNVDILLVTEPSDMITISLLSSHSREEFYEKLERYHRRTKCNAGRNIVSIYPDLSVYPCQFNNLEKIGNLENDELLKIVERYNKDRICKGCRLYKYCEGCMIRTYGNVDVDCTFRGLLENVYSGSIHLESWKENILKETLSLV